MKKSLISYGQALRKIIARAYILPAEKVCLKDSLGRVLKDNVFSKIEMPPFDKSAVDGYALNFFQAREFPARLKCVGLTQAGEIFRKKISKGECVKIMTGAPLPAGTNSVVMVEDTRASGRFVTVFKKTAKFENVCLRAEDIKCGQKIIEKGKKITPSEIALLATVGMPFVRVMRQPRAAVLNTGGEITPLGMPLGKKRIYNSNGPLLEALLSRDGARTLNLGIVKDDAYLLENALRRGLQSDMLLISGGVSMGDYDLVPDVLRSLGVNKIFHKVNIKPGKPLFFGVRGKTIIFGIPGNPVSNFLSYFIFIRPALKRMSGIACRGPEFKKGILTRGFKRQAGRRHFVLVKVARKENAYYLTPLYSHGSADTLSLSRADGFMVVDENVSLLKARSEIEFITWKTI